MPSCGQRGRSIGTLIDKEPHGWSRGQVCTVGHGREHGTVDWPRRRANRFGQRAAVLSLLPFPRLSSGFPAFLLVLRAQALFTVVRHDARSHECTDICIEELVAIAPESHLIPGPKRASACDCAVCALEGLLVFRS